jgi:hypothetical protein
MLRLGKHPPRHDPRTLRLGRYLKLAELPPLPPSVSWSSAVLSAGGYPLFLNDQLGDCAIAGPGHMIQTWSANAGTIQTPTDEQILQAYRDVSGYDPADPSTDIGCNLLDVLNYWRQAGIGGVKIGAYAAISGWTELCYAVSLLGGALLGVSLPDSVVQGDFLANPWDDSVVDAPNPANGHCICSADFSVGQLPVETWGAVKPMSQGFADRFIDEAYVIFSESWLRGDGTAPNGIDRVALLADLQAITTA